MAGKKWPVVPTDVGATGLCQNIDSATPCLALLRLTSKFVPAPAKASRARLTRTEPSHAANIALFFSHGDCVIILRLDKSAEKVGLSSAYRPGRMSPDHGKCPSRPLWLECEIENATGGPLWACRDKKADGRPRTTKT
jgi:hypothetical protein